MLRRRITNGRRFGQLPKGGGSRPYFCQKGGECHAYYLYISCLGHNSFYKAVHVQDGAEGKKGKPPLGQVTV